MQQSISRRNFLIRKVMLQLKMSFSRPYRRHNDLARSDIKLDRNLRYFLNELNTKVESFVGYDKLKLVG